jgi:hypothetical protein
MDPNEVQGVQFEEDQWKSGLPTFADEGPWIVRLLIKYSGGTVRDQKTAEYILLGLVIVIIIVSVFLFFNGGGNRPTSGEVPAGQFVP